VSAKSARLTRLSVRDFRNLAHVELTPPSAGWVVVGENGQGKTNLLEAIHYLQLLRSSRGVRDQDVVRFGADGFYVAAEIDVEGCHEVAVGFERAGHRKRARLDGAVPERLSDALAALPSVMFSPDDVALIAGSAAERRRYLDVMLATTNRPYLVALQKYRAALARRNAALRAAGARGDSSAIDAVAVWEPALAESGAVLWRDRREWVASMENRLETLCGEIGESAPVRMRYASSLAATGDARDARDALARALEDKRGSDLRRGLTHVGPHRDDLAITLDGRDLRVFGSAGQHRTAAIALRMLEASTVSERRGVAPMFLLDDPFAELDARRSARILALLERGGMGGGQTVLVVPRESDIPGSLTQLVRYRIVGGVVTPDDVEHAP
jgi:DNA replication and repair protein RecF